MISAELLCKTLTAAGTTDGKKIGLKYDVVEGTTPANSVYQCVFTLYSSSNSVDSTLSFYIGAADAVAFWVGFDGLTSANPVGAPVAKAAKPASGKSKKK